MWVKKWLKSGYIKNKRLFPTKKGTPQGGAISPMIMNMVLDGLETEINNKFPRWKRQKVNFIRYADDFVITAIEVIRTILQKQDQENNQKKTWYSCTCLNPYFEPSHSWLVELP
jgi:retron-type reverse transcriptase